MPIALGLVYDDKDEEDDHRIPIGGLRVWPSYLGSDLLSTPAPFAFLPDLIELIHICPTTRSPSHLTHKTGANTGQNFKISYFYRIIKLIML